MKLYYAIIYSRGPSWKGDKNWDKQDLMAHGEYISTLHTQGKVVLGGPFNDGSGGQTLVEVESRDEVNKIVSDDPAIQNGVFIATIRPWLIAFERQ